jgi:hypothetical protein
MVGKDIYTNCGTVGQTEWPDGEVGRSGRMERPDGVARQRSPRYPIGEQGRRTLGWVPNGGWTGARRRAHRCLTETGNGPTEGWMCARRRAGSRGVAQRRVSGWPNGGLYKGWWPSFLGTLLLRPIAPARNVGAQGANE